MTSTDNGTDERVAKTFTTKVSDATFTFETIKFDDPIITAAQIAERVGAHPVAQFKILQQLTTGEIETKRPNETTDLRELGVERFFVVRSDRTYSFTVDGLAMEWPLPTMTGKHMRELARATDHQDLVRVTPSGFELVDEADLVTLENCETEEFRKVERRRIVTIYYREQPFEVERREWSTEELIALFKVPDGHKLDLIKPDGEFKELKPEQKIKVREGMEFTSHVPAGQSS